MELASRLRLPPPYLRQRSEEQRRERSIRGAVNYVLKISDRIRLCCLSELSTEQKSKEIARL
jgi:hypothetical protein